MSKYVWPHYRLDRYRLKIDIIDIFHLRNFDKSELEKYIKSAKTELHLAA